MNIILLLGSIREGRKTDRVARYLNSILQSIPEVNPHLVDLRDYDIPMLEYRWQKVEEPAPGLVRLGTQLKQADAMIFISPEYHGSYTGVLKNAIDHYWKEFSRKPIGVVSTGSGKMGGINGSIEMQQLVLSLGAYPMPLKLLVPYVQNTFDELDQPTDEKLKEQSMKFLEEYVWFARAIVKAKELDRV